MIRKNLLTKYLSNDVLVPFPFVELFSPESKGVQEEYIEEE